MHTPPTRLPRSFCLSGSSHVWKNEIDKCVDQESWYCRWVNATALSSCSAILNSTAGCRTLNPAPYFSYKRIAAENATRHDTTTLLRHRSQTSDGKHHPGGPGHVSPSDSLHDESSLRTQQGCFWPHCASLPSPHCLPLCFWPPCFAAVGGVPVHTGPLSSRFCPVTKMA